MLLISLLYFPITRFCCWDRNVLIVIDILIIHCLSHCTSWHDVIIRSGRVNILPAQCYTIITNRTLLYEKLQAEFVKIHQHLDTMECKLNGRTFSNTYVTIFVLRLMGENSIFQNLLKRINTTTSHIASNITISLLFYL